MKKLYEDENEIYIEVDSEDLPLNIHTSSKTLYVKLSNRSEEIRVVIYDLVFIG
jgi:hypothetical protein